MDWSLKYREAGGSWSTLASGNDDNNQSTTTKSVTGLDDDTNYEVILSVAYSDDTSLSVTAESDATTLQAIQPITASISTPSDSGKVEVENISGGIAGGTYTIGLVKSLSYPLDDLTIYNLNNNGSPDPSHVFTQANGSSNSLDDGSRYYVIISNNNQNTFQVRTSEVSRRADTPTITDVSVSSDQASFRVLNTDHQTAKIFWAVKKGFTTIQEGNQDSISPGNKTGVVTVSNLEGGTDYRIEAKGKLGTSSVSLLPDLEYFTTPVNPPTGVLLQSTYSENASLSWSHPSGSHDGYRIEIQYNYTGWSFFNNASSSSTSLNNINVCGTQSGYTNVRMRIRTEITSGDTSD